MDSHTQTRDQLGCGITSARKNAKTLAQLHKWTMETLNFPLSTFNCPLTALSPCFYNEQSSTSDGPQVFRFTSQSETFPAEATLPCGRLVLSFIDIFQASRSRLLRFVFCRGSLSIDAVVIACSYGMNRDQLRALIISSLNKQGFVIRGDKMHLPKSLEKVDLRELHAQAVAHNRAVAKKALEGKESQLLGRFANGTEVDPNRITPRLIEVRSYSADSALFRYAGLHWSIPVSSGYGRRLRFLVIDENNEKLIGIIGLGDPIFSLGARDRWVGWTKEAQKARLHNVMDAFVLGAVPPYSALLGGKLIAMLLLSDEIRDAFKKKYGGRKSLIRGKELDARLSLITTMSALGRSSIYNRLKLGTRLVLQPVGMTLGSGEFHFSNGLYAPIAKYTLANCEPTYKKAQWGEGFRSRREVVKKCLSDLGLPCKWLYHGIGREIFVMALAHNTRQFLRGDHQKLNWFHHSTNDLASFSKERWMLPRSVSRPDYRTWERESWRIWGGR